MGFISNLENFLIENDDQRFQDSRVSKSEIEYVKNDAWCLIDNDGLLEIRFWHKIIPVDTYRWIRYETNGSDFIDQVFGSTIR